MTILPAYGRPDLCVMVGNGYAAYGTAVNM